MTGVNQKPWLHMPSLVEPYLTPQMERHNTVRTERQQNMRGPSRHHLLHWGLVKELPHSRGQGRGHQGGHCGGPVGLEALQALESSGQCCAAQARVPGWNCLHLSHDLGLKKTIPVTSWLLILLVICCPSSSSSQIP